MPTSYTSLLGLALPVTGELSGTWGDTVNDYITQYLDASVAGTQTISGSQTAVTLSKTTATSLSQAGSGATGSSQYNIINCTGNPASMLTVTVPAASKTYVVVNATSTNQDVKIVGAGPTTGVTLVAGEKAIIAWNGSDFIKVATSTADGVTTLSFGSTGLTPSTATSGAVTVAGTLVAANGGTGQSSYTTGDLLYATGSTALSKLGIGTNGQILTSTGTAPQWSTLSGVAVTTFSAGTTGFTPSTATSGAVTLAGTLATTNGGTGLTSFTANGVVYASSTSALTTGSALTFTGTRLGIGEASPVSALTVKSGNGDQATLNNAGERYTQFTLQNNGTSKGALWIDNTNSLLELYGYSGMSLTFSANASEQMRLTSTGLGIGTSSPVSKLDIDGNFIRIRQSGANAGYFGNAADLITGAPAGLGIRFDGSALRIAASSTQIATFDSSGNFGLGVTPSANGSIYYKSFELGKAGCGLFAATDSLTGSELTYLAGNAVLTYSAGPLWSYGNNGNAAAYGIEDGIYKWFTAPSGTAGNAISFTQAMTLDASGNLLVGTTSASAWSTAGRGLIEVNGSSSALIGLKTGNTQRGYMYTQGTDLIVLANTGALALSAETGSGIITLSTAGSERARITSVGNLSLGGTADRGTTVGTNAIQIFNGTAPAGTLTNGVSLYSSSGDLNFMNSAGNGFRVGYRNLPPVGTQTGSYTLAAGDVGKYVQVSTGGSITIPTSVFAEGDAISIYNNTTGNITITCSAPTAYIAGTNTVKTSMTLATRGVATILFYSATACVVSGNVT